MKHNPLIKPTHILLAVCLLLAAAGCKLKPESTPPDSEPTAIPVPAEEPAAPEIEEPVYLDLDHNSRNSLDWDGTYRGILPCADCPGIQTSITLFANGDFTRTRTYQGKSDPALNDNGHFQWNEVGSVVTLTTRDGSRSHRYLVGENKLIQLYQDQQPMTVEEGEKNLLKKIIPDPELEDRKWFLGTLGGKAAAEANGKQAFLTFHSALGQFTGNNTCNLMVAEYTVTGGKAIQIAAMASTRKACPEMGVADGLAQALAGAARYQVQGNTLTLLDPSQEMLAQFTTEDPIAIKEDTTPEMDGN